MIIQHKFSELQWKNNEFERKLYMEMSILSNIPFGGGHLEKASITGKRGISRDVSLENRILRLKIYKYGDFHKKNIKTLTPNESLKSALVYYTCERNGSVVEWVALVTFLENWGDVCTFPDIW